MATNNRPLKAYVRFDGSGRIVAGSLILRKQKPKVGKWQEIPAYECCNPTSSTNYNVAGCERMEYHVITYTGVGVLPEGTIVNNATPECWYIVDQTTAPADVGTITYVWPTLGECSFCIDSHTTTTTTTSPG